MKSVDSLHDVRATVDYIFTHFIAYSFLLSFRYPPGYFIQNYEFDFFNYAGIHRPVLLYTTPQVFISDISVISDLLSNNTEGTLNFKALIISPEIYRASLMIAYELYDSDDQLVASEIGPGLHSGILRVSDVNPWWPIGMSDAPGYLYKLKVRQSPKMLVEDSINF